MRSVGYSYRMSPGGGSLSGMLFRAAINAAGLFLASAIVPGVRINDW